MTGVQRPLARAQKQDSNACHSLLLRFGGSILSVQHHVRTKRRPRSWPSTDARARAADVLAALELTFLYQGCSSV